MTDTPPFARPYNVIDCETTGFAEDAQLMEIARCIVTLDAERKTAVGEPHAELFRPTCEIEPGARATHHITAAMVADRFPATTDDRTRFVQCPDLAVPPAVVVAHNIEYEEKFFSAEIGETPRLCTYKAALRVWPDAPSHSNGVLYYWLQDQGLVPDLGDAAHPMHRAGPDTLITGHILAALLQLATTAEMLEWTSEPRLLPTCPNGKWRGKPWSEVEAGYLKWMLGTDMEEDIKWNVQRELDRRAGQRSLL